MNYFLEKIIEYKILQYLIVALTIAFVSAGTFFVLFYGTKFGITILVLFFLFSMIRDLLALPKQEAKIELLEKKAKLCDEIFFFVSGKRGRIISADDLTEEEKESSGQRDKIYTETNTGEGIALIYNKPKKSE